MKTYTELVAYLKSAQSAGFDVSDAKAGEAVNRWIKRLASISKWIREEREFGPTTLGTDLYEIPADVIDVHALYVDGASTQRVSTTELFDLKNGSASLTGGPPWIVYSPRYGSDGTKKLGIYPIPGPDGPDVGATITGLCSVIPADISGSQQPPFPDDFEDTILNGARATLHRDLDNDPEMGQLYEDKFLADAEFLRRRGNSRVGSGAFAIPIG